MVKIEYYEVPKETYVEFDTLMSIATGRHQLMDKKRTNTGIRNTIVLFAEALILFLMADGCRLLMPDNDPLFSKILVGLGFLLVGFNALLLAFSVKGFKERRKRGHLKADLIFDICGIHAWETETRGVDINWRNVTHCFISRKQIYLLFTDKRFIITIPYTKEHRDKIIQAMMIGKKLEIVKFIDVKKGIISIRNK